AFWQRISPGHPPQLRAAALQALGTLAPPRDKNRIRQLVECACDSDFRVAAPALMILKGIPIPASSTKDCLTLFDAPDPAVRRFVIEKFGTCDRADVAKGLAGQLGHPDQSVREEALTRLCALKAGRSILLDALLEASTAEGAWNLARPVARFAGQYAKAFGRLFKQASNYLEADDRRADALLFLLRQIDAKSLRARLEHRAFDLRKKKRYEPALLYLRLMARDPACSEDVRFELAACGLKLSDHNLAVESRNSDPALQQFARLLRSDQIPPAALSKHE